MNLIFKSVGFEGSIQVTCPVSAAVKIGEIVSVVKESSGEDKSRDVILEEEADAEQWFHDM